VTQAVLDDWRTAPVEPDVRATLGLLEKITLHPDAVGPGDVDEVRQMGVSDQAISDAMHVCYLFNAIDRLADAFDFALLSEEGYRKGAEHLLKRGYALIPWLTG
jgi:alkylhydroperoxidase family enzyme